MTLPQPVTKPFVKPRYVALTDIDNEPDDAQSFVRLLLYTNDIDLEGVIAVTSAFLPTEVHPETLHDIVQGYRLAHPNLLRHSADYPSADYVDSIIAAGNPTFGMAEIGEGHDSAGSELLIRVVDKDDQRLVHLGLWGGANTLAQALWKVRATRSKEELDRFVDKMQVYAISDQDDAGPWIRRNFPMLRYIVTIAGQNSYGFATWSGISSDIHGLFDGPDRTLVSKEWISEHIQIGPLGAKYPSYKFIMEGDTPSYLGIIPNGLNVADRIDFGGWGGRYKKLLDPESRHYHDSNDSVISPVDGKKRDGTLATLWRWRPEFQNDFAARMQWTLDSPSTKPNHPPTVVVNGHETYDPLYITAHRAETITLDASKSFDIDGDMLRYEWFQYKEAETILPATFEVKTLDFHGTENACVLKVTLPESTVTSVGFITVNEHSQNYHIILRVTDDGVPALSRYKRVIVTVVE
ncbi:hypothetical protein NliqN6_4345 [Naganishia liquefaciens]|uniref:DUF1593-domain-containing protein n=1 Tax=Naganishia liquefaciens TaxID=104408 RepID=A0A8H3TVN3_9TREE|nr:hypothetical protein NliqN6_4345 [Naganishia liquefaciens]